jgi:hypothetical protein
MWGALSEERMGLSFARLSQQKYVSCQYVQFAYYKLLNVCIYNIYKAQSAESAMSSYIPLSRTFGKHVAACIVVGFT